MKKTKSSRVEGIFKEKVVEGLFVNLEYLLKGKEGGNSLGSI